MGRFGIGPSPSLLHGAAAVRSFGKAYTVGWAQRGYSRLATDRPIRRLSDRLCCADCAKPEDAVVVRVERVEGLPQAHAALLERLRCQGSSGTGGAERNVGGRLDCRLTNLTVRMHSCMAKLTEQSTAQSSPKLSHAPRVGRGGWGRAGGPGKWDPRTSRIKTAWPRCLSACHSSAITKSGASGVDCHCLQRRARNSRAARDESWRGLISAPAWDFGFSACRAAVGRRLST